MPILTAMIAGLLFGVGLIVSGMANPSKVLQFLDLSGNWDPSLAFVMLGAILIAAMSFGMMKNRRRSLLQLEMQIPKNSALTLQLILGSLSFGIGWGLAGFCPGPALVAAAAGSLKAWGFVAAMIVGMAVFEYIPRLWRREH